MLFNNSCKSNQCISAVTPEHLPRKLSARLSSFRHAVGCTIVVDHRGAPLTMSRYVHRTFVTNDVEVSVSDTCNKQSSLSAKSILLIGWYI